MISVSVGHHELSVIIIIQTQLKPISRKEQDADNI